MVNSFLPYLRLTVEIFQFLRLSTKFLTVLRPSVNPIETLIDCIGRKKSAKLGMLRKAREVIPRESCVTLFIIHSNISLFLIG